jgi:Ca-activated chloride channel family protein
MFKKIIYLGLIVLLEITSAHATNTINSAGELEINANNGQPKIALLLDTAINGEVNGMLANITVKQTFKNNSDDWVNGRYVFPLPEGAAVDSLKIQIGERIINGVIKEKEVAKRTFEQAKRSGKKAGLLQQHRPNLFSIAVANIGPQENIIATITFIDRVDYQNDTFSLRLPTTLTPRYIPNAPIKLSPEQRLKREKQLHSELEENQHVDISTGNGWAANTARVPDANNITPPQTYSNTGQTSHRFSLDLVVKSGLNLQSISSDSHPISYHESGTEISIALTNGHELMNSDLTLSWNPIIGTAPKAALFQQVLEKDYFSMVMVTPPAVSATVSLPRDVTFIVDSSGSMAGQSMAQAKQALRDALNYLNAGDRFNIVDFDSQYRPLYSQSQVVSYDHIEQAKKMINGLNADGGTEMVGALKFALQSRNDKAYLKQIIFITDGSIGNESELFKLINKELNDARLFTVGIGSAPNAYFMSKAAKFGRGTYTYINDLAKVQTTMAELFAKITKPVLRDVVIDWPTEVEQYPARIPDLYAGEPLNIMVRSSKPIDTVKVSGTMLNTPWAQTLNIAQNGRQQANNLDTVWARQKVGKLMDQYHTGELSQDQIKPQVVKLGIDHHILTKFTAFVAIEATPSKPLEMNAKQKSVTNLMPKGSAMPTPNTSTSSALLCLLGALLILLSTAIKRGIGFFRISQSIKV